MGNVWRRERLESSCRMSKVYYNIIREDREFVYVILSVCLSVVLGPIRGSASNPTTNSVVCCTFDFSRVQNGNNEGT